MGMDIYGLRPSSEVGKYFRSSGSAWCDIANYICKVAPDIASACKYWDTNDGDGLNRLRSQELAEILQQEIDSGRIKSYEQVEKIHCWVCSGTGVRRTDPKGQCFHCDGKGFSYPAFDVPMMRNFVRFLSECGGFEIC